MTAQEIVQRWLGSDKGDTPIREAKAKALAQRSNIDWADVLAAKDAYLANPKT